MLLMTSSQTSMTADSVGGRFVSLRRRGDRRPGQVGGVGAGPVGVEHRARRPPRATRRRCPLPSGWRRRRRTRGRPFLARQTTPGPARAYESGRRSSRTDHARGPDPGASVRRRGSVRSVRPRRRSHSTDADHRTSTRTAPALRGRCRLPGKTTPGCPAMVRLGRYDGMYPSGQGVAASLKRHPNGIRLLSEALVKLHRCEIDLCRSEGCFVGQ